MLAASLPFAREQIMSTWTPNSERVQNLTQSEQILHHHAAIAKRYLEAYIACSRSQEDWIDLFREHLACFILTIHAYMPFSDLSRLEQ